MTVWRMENILLSLLGESLLKVAALSMAVPEIVEAVVVADPGSFLGSNLLTRLEG